MYTYFLEYIFLYIVFYLLSLFTAKGNLRGRNMYTY